MRSSRTEILPFTISIEVLLFISPACSIIGDEVDGRADALTGICRRGGREEERLLLLLLLVDICLFFANYYFEIDIVILNYIRYHVDVIPIVKLCTRVSTSSVTLTNPLAEE